MKKILGAESFLRMAVSRWIDLGKNRWGGARLFEIAGVGAGFGVVRGSRLEDRGAEEEFCLLYTSRCV